MIFFALECCAVLVASIYVVGSDNRPCGVASMKRRRGRIKGFIWGSTGAKGKEGREERVESTVPTTIGTGIKMSGEVLYIDYGYFVCKLPFYPKFNEKRQIGRS